MTSAQSDALNAAEREAATSSTGPPDWSTCELELECPRCGYNLRGLTGSRCPECGLELNWPAIVKATANFEHVPLFEYQWNRHFVQSVLRSLVMSVTPWRTWKLIPLTAKPRVELLFPLIILASTLAIPLRIASEAAGTVIECLGSSIPLSMAYFRFSVVNGDFGWRAFVHNVLIGATVLLLLCIFRQTLARRGIRYGHLARIATFIAIAMIVRGALQPAFVALSYVRFFRGSSGMLEQWIAPLFDLSFILLVTWSLAAALRDYLQIERGGLIAVSVVFLTVLIWTTATIMWSIQIGDWSNELVWLFQGQWPGLGSLIDRLFGF